MAKKNTNRINKIKQKKPSRRTFGQGVEAILNTYGLTGKSIFEDKKYSATVTRRWQKFESEEPKIALMLREHALMSGSVAERLDRLMSGVNANVEYVVKSLIADISLQVINLLKKENKILKITNQSSLFERYLFLNGYNQFEFASDIDNAFENIKLLFQHQDKHSFEYILVLLHQSSMFLTTRKRILEQSNLRQTADQYFKELWAVILASQKYRFLIYSIASLTIRQFFIRRGIEYLNESKRFTLAFSIISENPPADLFSLANQEIINDQKLEDSLLNLLSWIFEYSPSDDSSRQEYKGVTDFNQYKKFLKQLLNSSIFNLERFCNKEIVGNFFHFHDRYGQDLRPLFNTFIDYLWLMLRWTLLSSPNDKVLKKLLFLKLYQAMLLVNFSTRFLPKTCPNIIKYLLETFALLQVDINKEKSIISHYTTAENAHTLLLNDKSTYFRLMSTFGLNDAYEGKVFLKYLDIDSDDFREETKNMLAFVGCFTFRHNDYNQFRLYGKSSSNGAEAGGVALEMNKNFFSNYTDFTQAITNLSNPDPQGSHGRVLYRCVYMNKYDPTNITSISGFQSDDCKKNCEEESRLKDKLHILLEKIKKTYTKNIARKILKINNQKESLLSKIPPISVLIKSEQDRENLNQRTRINEEARSRQNEIELEQMLLIQLAHLIKNDDYKDEEECRIMFITQITIYANTEYNHDEKINIDLKPRYNPLIKGINGVGNLYVEDKRDMRTYIDRIILGENFSNTELFLNKLRLRLDDLEQKINPNVKSNLEVTTRNGETIDSIYIRKDL